MLTVVLIQRIAEDASRTDGQPVAAGLSAVLDRTVNTLITMRGLDLRLVDHIPAAESSSPDRLALEMTEGPVAVLGWHPATTLAQSWTDGSLRGRRSRHRLDPYDSDTPSRAAGPDRPLYLINLCDAPDPEALADTLERLSEATQVRVFSLGSSSLVSPKPPAGARNTEKAAEASPPPTPRAPTPSAPRPSEVSPTDQKLQDWVDQLDSFDS